MPHSGETDGGRGDQPVRTVSKDKISHSQSDSAMTKNVKVTCPLLWYNAQIAQSVLWPVEQIEFYCRREGICLSGRVSRVSYQLKDLSLQSAL